MQIYFLQPFFIQLFFIHKIYLYYIFFTFYIKKNSHNKTLKKKKSGANKNMNRQSTNLNNLANQTSRKKKNPNKRCLLGNCGIAPDLELGSLKMKVRMKQSSSCSRCDLCGQCQLMISSESDTAQSTSHLLSLSLFSSCLLPPGC